MYDNISFLYNEKNCKSFWFAMGPEGNYESQMRAKALVDFAKENGLKKNKDYFLDFSGDIVNQDASVAFPDMVV